LKFPPKTVSPSHKNPFDGRPLAFRLAPVQKDLTKIFAAANGDALRGITRSKSYTDVWSRKLFLLFLNLHGLGAFALITLGVMLRKRRVAVKLMHPRIRREINRSGVELMPMFAFLALGLGFLVVGQAVSALAKVGAINYLGSTMVIVVVRELGPLLTAMFLLARVGTAHVIELGTARAMGDVEALESLGIDPIHYLIVPRVIGLMTGMFSLTIYLIVGALVSGYLCASLQKVPLAPDEYFRSIAQAMTGFDFLFLVLKTIILGFLIAIVACYNGLAQPLRLEDVSGVAVRAVTQGVVIPMLIDLLFIVLYLLTL
jgi:phospholipid/cholesterol/gamma-HCH transport system permease protein